MKNFKKFTALFSLTCLLGVLIVFPSSASGDSSPVLDMIPEDVYTLIELAPEEVNDTLQDLYEQGVEYITNETFIPSYMEEEAEAALSEAWIEQLSTQTLTMGVTASVYDPAFFIFTEISEEDFENLISLHGEYITPLFEEEAEAAEVENGAEEETEDDTEDDTLETDTKDDDSIEFATETTITAEIYEPDTWSTFYLMYHDGYLALATATSFLEELDTGFENPIGDNSGYQDVSQEFLNDNFLNVYLDLETISVDAELSSLLADDEMTVLDAIADYGLSIKENNDGFSFQQYLTTDASILSALGIDYSSSLGVPYLYQFMPSMTPISYVEGFNLRQAWDSLSGMEEVTEDIEDTLEEEFGGLSLNDELLPLFEEGAAVLVQDSGELFPTLTVLLDVDGNETLTDVVINKIIDGIWGDEEDVITEEGDDFTLTITKDQEEMLGGEMTTILFEVEEEEMENPYAIYTPEEWLSFKLTMGVTEDGLFLFSTNKTIDENYGEDLLDDDGFDRVFDEDSDEEVSSISYISLDNIGSYTSRILEEFAEIDPLNIANFEQAQEAIDNFFGVFHDIYGISIQTNDYSSSTSDWRFDFDEIADLWTYFEEMSDTSDSSFSALSNSQTDFDDVKAAEWYGDDVYYLSTNGIINGHPDGTYQPEGDINRAEFLTLLMGAMEEKGYFTGDVCAVYYGCIGFEDVEQYWDWYGEDAYHARSLGITEGYENPEGEGRIFSPGKSITRAEAVAMIAKVLELVEVSADFQAINDLGFYDVNEGDWYYDAVKTARSYHIISESEDGYFWPERSLNRAESAKIIRILFNIVEETS